MTPEEYEKAFCKGKRQAMEVFNDWLKEHIRTAQYGLEHGVDAGKVLGCTVDVTTIDGKTIAAKIPSLIEEGTQLRFRGYGMPLFNSDARGDMIGVVKLVMPEKIDEEDKRLLEQLCERDNFK